MTSLDTSHTSEIYSKSLFELACGQQLVDIVKNDLDALNNMITADNDFWVFMTSPNFSLKDKQQMLEKAGAGFNALTLNFLMVALSHNKTASLPHIIAKYERLFQNYHKVCNIQVTLSQPLDPQENDELRAALSAAVNSDKIMLDTVIEPSIIGGIIIRCNDKIVDNSVRGRLYRAVETTITRGKNRGKIYEN